MTQEPTEDHDYENTVELFAFLQGVVPDDCTIETDHVPRLTADQAWKVIWYLGNQYWQVTDYIERCCVCGELYDTRCDGECLDFGHAPYHFCGSCCNGSEARDKRKVGKALGKLDGYIDDDGNWI